MIHLLPCSLADSSMIFISSLSCADSFDASQVHGDTDTPIDSVLQKTVRSTGGTRLTRETCLISGITSLALDPKITQPSGLLRATKLAFSLVSPTWKREQLMPVRISIGPAFLRTSLAARPNMLASTVVSTSTTSFGLPLVYH